MLTTIVKRFVMIIMITAIIKIDIDNENNAKNIRNDSNEEHIEININDDDDNKKMTTTGRTVVAMLWMVTPIILTMLTMTMIYQQD